MKCYKIYTGQICQHLPFSNVKINNIGSASCTDFTQWISVNAEIKFIFLTYLNFILQLKKNYGVAHSNYMSPKFFKSSATFYLPVFSIGILNFYKVVFVKFSECSKAYQSCGRLPNGCTISEISYQLLCPPLMTSFL